MIRGADSPLINVGRCEVIFHILMILVFIPNSDIVANEHLSIYLKIMICAYNVCSIVSPNVRTTETDCGFPFLLFV